MRLIAIDMDHTFLRENKTYDIERTYSVFKALRKQGDIICIATGNPIQILKKYFDDEFDPMLYYAADNGSFIFKEGRVLDMLSIERSSFEKIMKVIDSYDDIHTVVTTDRQAYTKTKSLKTFREVNDVLSGFGPVNDWSQIPSRESIIKVSSYSQKPIHGEIVRKIKTTIPYVDAVRSAPLWNDVYNERSGKGHAINYLQNKYFISQANTICFGDSLNDESMMKRAKYSVAVSNADPVLKAQCDYEIGSNDEESVLDLLENLIQTDNWEFMKQYKK